MRNWKISIADIIRVIILLIALSVLLYPTVSNYLVSKNGSRAVENYEKLITELSDEEIEEIFARADEYNRSLVGHASLDDPFGTGESDEDSVYNSLLNVSGNGMMGYIKIPKIDVKLPIYHGTSDGVLQKYVGHFSDSSLPVGGESTHAVLTGHRGLPSARLFTDLDKITQGDIFYVTVLNRTLAYQVDQILTVLPHETEALRIVDGADYVTLVTCTPYGVNTHRLLIRGHRIPYVEAVAAVPDEADGFYIPFEILVLIIALLILLVVFIIWRILARRKARAADGAGAGYAQGRAGQDVRRRRHRRRRSRK